MLLQQPRTVIPGFRCCVCACRTNFYYLVPLVFRGTTKRGWNLCESVRCQKLSASIRHLFSSSLLFPPHGRHQPTVPSSAAGPIARETDPGRACTSCLHFLGLKYFAHILRVACRAVVGLPPRGIWRWAQLPKRQHARHSKNAPISFFVLGLLNCVTYSNGVKSNSINMARVQLRNVCSVVIPYLHCMLVHTTVVSSVR